MRYALFPFPSLNDAGGADLRSKLQGNAECNASGVSPVRNLELVDETVRLLRELPWEIAVDFCDEDRGRLRLAVVAPDLGRDVDTGDVVKAGFFLENAEETKSMPSASARLYRVACENGYLVECGEGQATVLAGDWRSSLARVVDRSFAAEGIDRETARFRSTMRQMLMAPYELLCNLVAQGILSEDEQSAIQAEFDNQGDYTLYGFINAVTRVAAQCRDSDEWKRAVELERLGGEILHGGHQPPVMEPAFA